MTPTYDMVIVGNVSVSLVYPFGAPIQKVVGGPVVMAAMATSWSNKRVAVVTKMAERDMHHLDILRTAGIKIYAKPVRETSQNTIFHLTENVDLRRVYVRKTAGAITADDLPRMRARSYHLAAATNQEFGMDLLYALAERGCPFSVDMQSFVRQLDEATGEARAADFPEKAQVAAMADKVKLDVVEAEILTGTADLEQAAIQFEKWGSGEVMITRSDGALVRCGGRSYFEPFTNRWTRGRTGRGDTTFASYLIRRLDYDAPVALKFAVAVASMKLETRGPFNMTLDEVMRRMAHDQAKRASTGP